MLVALKGKSGTFQTAPLGLRNFRPLADGPRARYIAPTDRHHGTLNQQVPHLAPIFLDPGNRLLKAKPP
jgi:hypothetical protein